MIKSAEFQKQKILIEMKLIIKQLNKLKSKLYEKESQQTLREVIEYGIKELSESESIKYSHLEESRYKRELMSKRKKKKTIRTKKDFSTLDTLSVTINNKESEQKREITRMTTKGVQATHLKIANSDIVYHQKLIKKWRKLEEHENINKAKQPKKWLLFEKSDYSSSNNNKYEYFDKSAHLSHRQNIMPVKPRIKKIEYNISHNTACSFSSYHNSDNRRIKSSTRRRRQRDKTINLKNESKSESMRRSNGNKPNGISNNNFKVSTLQSTLLKKKANKKSFYKGRYTKRMYRPSIKKRQKLGKFGSRLN